VIYPNSCINFGGGVNSVAMVILLVNGGWTGPIVFSDTQTEHPETYCYMDMFEQDWLKPRGLEIVRLKGLPWQKYGNGLSLIDYCEKMEVIPVAMIRWCTSRWKGRPLDRWRKAHNIKMPLIGIAANESHRMPTHCRPLCDWHITRQKCVEVIEHEGLSIPCKSSCYICPLQRTSQWRELWEKHPELFERAARLEENANKQRIKRRAILDPSGKQTLRDLEKQFNAQKTLFDGTDWNKLLRYKPYICTLQ